MTVPIRVTVIVLALLLAAPGLAVAVCFDVIGLPEAVALDLSTLAASLRGDLPVVGEAQGLCGLGEPPALVQGTAFAAPGGSARVAVKLLAARQGCSGGEAEFVLPPPFTTGTGQVRLPEGSVANVRLTLDPAGVACQPRTPRPDACVANVNTLCLQQSRFRITANRSGPSAPLPGQTVKNSGESGYFSFSGPSNLELAVKVLNGCALNDNYWVSHAPISNVEYTITVTDTKTGQVKTYSNPQSPALAPVLDVSAFSTCP